LLGFCHQNHSMSIRSCYNNPSSTPVFSGTGGQNGT
jgi:hypothetical protein